MPARTLVAHHDRKIVLERPRSTPHLPDKLKRCHIPAGKELPKRRGPTPCSSPWANRRTCSTDRHALFRGASREAVADFRTTMAAWFAAPASTKPSKRQSILHGQIRSIRRNTAPALLQPPSTNLDQRPETHRAEPFHESGHVDWLLPTRTRSAGPSVKVQRRLPNGYSTPHR